MSKATLLAEFFDNLRLIKVKDLFLDSLLYDERYTVVYLVVETLDIFSVS